MDSLGRSPNKRATVVSRIPARKFDTKRLCPMAHLATGCASAKSNSSTVGLLHGSPAVFQGVSGAYSTTLSDDRLLWCSECIGTTVWASRRPSPRNSLLLEVRHRCWGVGCNSTNR
jgi:hypothetical protein